MFAAYPIDAFGPPLAAIAGAILIVVVSVWVYRDMRRERERDRRPVTFPIGDWQDFTAHTINLTRLEVANAQRALADAIASGDPLRIREAQLALHDWTECMGKSQLAHVRVLDGHPYDWKLEPA